MLIFSSVHNTYSPGPKGWPATGWAYRSSTRLALAWKFGTADEDPGAVLPGLERVLGQPAADRCGRDRRGDAPDDGLAGRILLERFLLERC
jgi:hypothetical protein